jgi:HEAT repeat protein
MKTTEQKLRIIQAIEKEVTRDKNCALGTKLLAPFLEEEDIAVRTEALRVLHCFDSEKSLKLLKNLLKAKEPETRMKAVLTLGEIATAESLSLLVGMVYDPDMGVRKAVIKKLNEVKNKKLIKSDLFNEKLQFLLTEIRKREKWIMD